MSKPFRDKPLGLIVLWLVIGVMASSSVAGPLVGAYYYPWHGPFRGGHGFADTLRQKLNPPQAPAIGLYDSRAASTISSHIDQSRRGNISFWAVSWWGPNSTEDITLRNHIFTQARAAEMKYAILYEATARLGTFNSLDFKNLVSDFQYMAKNIFSNPNYLKINGRPVVYVYLTRVYFNTQAGRDAVMNLRKTIQDEDGYNPYIVGDDLFGSGNVDTTRARLWDAITDYDVYGTVLQSQGSTQAAIDSLKTRYGNWKKQANAIGVGFVPAATPGFNDSGVRRGHVAAPRYLPGEAEGSLFAKMLKEAAVPFVDTTAAEMLVITSFNEWHEDTQIEPTNVSGPTSRDSGNGTYTHGHNWTGYGDTYLDILKKETVVP